MYKTDSDIMNRLQEHLEAALAAYPEMDWFVLVAQGSMNYGMMDEESDIDSKLLAIPSFKEIVLNSKPRNKVFEMPNSEHVDIKDVREYFKIFRKQNINFVEILFSPYWIVNDPYADLWSELRRKAEELAHMNPFAAVSCMKGMALEKWHALSHPYPSRMYWIEKYGCDPKQASHIARIRYFIKHYVEGDKYVNCIYPSDPSVRLQLLNIKRGTNFISLEYTQHKCQEWVDDISRIADEYRLTHKNEVNQKTDEWLNSVLYRLLSRSVKEQLHD